MQDLPGEEMENHRLGETKADFWRGRSCLNNAEEFSLMLCCLCRPAGRGEPRRQARRAVISVCNFLSEALAIGKVWSNGKYGKLPHWLEN